jgi:hypothetical protein
MMSASADIEKFVLPLLNSRSWPKVRIVLFVAVSQRLTFTSKPNARRIELRVAAFG